MNEPQNSSHNQHSSHSQHISPSSPTSSGQNPLPSGQEEDPLGVHHYCRWGSCNLHFADGDDLYRHICTDHITKRPRKKSKPRSFDPSVKEPPIPPLYCEWENCQVCVQKRDHLTSHARIHIDTKPFECDQCFRKFKRPQDLKKHLRIHKESGNSNDIAGSYPPYTPSSLNRTNQGGSAFTHSGLSGSYGASVGTPIGGPMGSQRVPLHALGAPLSAIGGAPAMGAPFGAIPLGPSYGFSLGAPLGPPPVSVSMVGAPDGPETNSDGQSQQRRDSTIKQEVTDSPNPTSQEAQLSSSNEKYSDRHMSPSHALLGGPPPSLDAHQSPKQQAQPLHTAFPVPHSYPPGQFPSHFQQHVQQHPSYMPQQPMQPTHLIFPYVEQPRNAGSWHPAYVTPYNEMNPMMGPYSSPLSGHPSGQSAYIPGPDDLANPLEQLYGSSSSRPSDSSEYYSLGSTTESDQSFTPRRSSVSFDGFPSRRGSLAFDTFPPRRGSTTYDAYAPRTSSNVSYDSFGPRNSTVSHESMAAPTGHFPQLYHGGSRRPSMFESEYVPSSYEPQPHLPNALPGSQFASGTAPGVYGAEYQSVPPPPNHFANTEENPGDEGYSH